MKLLVKGIGHLVTMNARREILRDAHVLSEDGWITSVGTGPIPEGAAGPAGETLDADGGIVTPGLVNTHHHMFQNLARAYGPVSDLPLLPWLQGHLPLWRTFTADDLRVATEVALVELLLSGCTFTSDHHYLFPRGNGVTMDVQFAAAETLGIRFCGCRGCLDLASDIVPEWLTETVDEVVSDTVRLAQTFHDPKPGGMRSVATAPCTVFSASADLLRETAALAAQLGLRKHIHCGETAAENDDALDKLGCRPLPYLENLGWNDDRTWYAHGIHFEPGEIARIGQKRAGIAHCPTSNMRLGSGVCPVNRCRAHGIAVSLGVDGSASNDSGHLLAEARQALLLARVTEGAGAMSVGTALEIATLGGAHNLGRAGDLGSVEVGKCADLAVFPAADLGSSGAHAKVDGLLLCAPRHARHLVVHGQVRVRNGEIPGLDLPRLLARHEEASRAITDRR